MKTIAQQLNIKEFPFIIKDTNGNEIYFENSKDIGGNTNLMPTEIDSPMKTQMGIGANTNTILMVKKYTLKTQMEIGINENWVPMETKSTLKIQME
jgi:hypothetical protein